MIKYLENENFDDEVKNGKVLVDFYADWCGPCKMLGVVLEEIAKEKDIKILKVNVDSHEDLSARFRIMSIPYIVLFQDGKEAKHNLGFLSKEDLVNFIEE